MFSLPSANSLGLRLSLATCAVAVVFWLVAGVIATLVVSHEIDEALDSGLQEAAQLVLDLAERDPEFAIRGVPRQNIKAGRREYISYIVRDGSGRVLLASRHGGADTYTGQLSPGLHETAIGRAYKQVSVDGRLSVTTVEDKAHRLEAIHEAASPLIVMFLLLAPASFGLSILIINRGLRSLRRMRSELEEQADAGFTHVTTMSLPMELQPVGHAINGLIDRLERALRAERIVVANSAHEIRTPIAAALAQTQRLVSELPPGSAKDRAVLIEAALKRLAHMLARMLELSRADAASVLSSSPQDLGPVLDMLVRDFQQDYPERKIMLARPAGGAYSRLDPDAFAIILRNLLENAVKHGRGERPVDVVVTPGNELVVSNDGPCYAHEELQRLARPFQRGAPVETGSGLGLTIVKTIASAARLHLTFTSPPMGKADGFEARLQL